jgi:gamma-glutamylaminecyclotransferase
MFIFVYGSLKKNFKYHYLIEDYAIFVDKAKTKDLYSLYRYKNYDFPYLSKNKSFNIRGELYEINDFLLGQLDQLEGYPNFYTREKIAIISDSGITYNAIVYFLKESLYEKNKSLIEWLN